jgi:hypothetical protein
MNLLMFSSHRELTIQQVKESIDDVIQESKDNVECN